MGGRHHSGIMGGLLRNPHLARGGLPPPGGISNVPGILMKAAEQTRGMPTTEAATINADLLAFLKA
jgi:hypothetical protein